MNRSKAIDKIKKCLALAKSAEPHEAAAALRQAQKLMQEFGMEQLDVELSDVQETERRSTSLKVQAWEARLVAMIAEAFACEVFHTTRLIRNRSGWPKPAGHFVFVGVTPASDLAGYAFEVLLRQCTRLRAAHVAKQPKSCKPITKTARGDAFALGWVHGVRALVERFAGNPRDQALLEAYMAAKHPVMGTAKVGRRDVGRNIKDDAWEGAKAARTAQLNPGVDGPKGNPRLVLR